MSLLYACSLSLYIEGSQPNVLDNYSDNSIKEDTVSKWILNTAKKKKNNDEAYIIYSADSTPDTKILTIRKRIFEERQQIDPENEPVVYVDNPVEAQLPCRWIRRSLLREVIKERGKGNFIAKNLEDLTKHCMKQSEMINIRVKLHETTKEPTVIVENPVEANIACPFISRSKLRTIILNRAKDNVNGIDKTAENSVFFRLPIECARQQQEITQIKGTTNTYFTRSSRDNCMSTTTQANICATITTTTTRKSFVSTKMNAIAFIMMVSMIPRNTFVTSSSRATTYITRSSGNSKSIFGPPSAPSMGASIYDVTPIYMNNFFNTGVPKTTQKNTAIRSSIDTDQPKATQSITVEPAVTNTTTSDTRFSISPKNISAPTIDIGKPKTTQKNTFDLTTASSNTYAIRSSTSPRNILEPTPVRASLYISRPKKAQSNSINRAVTSTTNSVIRSSITSRITIEPTTMTASFDTDTPKTTQRNTFEPTLTSAITYSSRSSINPRNTMEPTATTVSVHTDKLQTTQRNTFDPSFTNTTTYTSRSSITPRNTMEPTTTTAAVHTDRPKMTQKNSLESSVTSSDLYSSRSSVSPSNTYGRTATSITASTMTSLTAQKNTNVLIVNETILSTLFKLFDTTTRNIRIKRTRTASRRNRRLKTSTRPLFSHGDYEY
ncbi:mucin-4-like isoform X2 [Cydia pomonella]|nr:mucin-4-like isoform X2 [Cydia pomonella]